MLLLPPSPLPRLLLLLLLAVGLVGAEAEGLEGGKGPTRLVISPSARRGRVALPGALSRQAGEGVCIYI